MSRYFFLQSCVLALGLAACGNNLQQLNPQQTQKFQQDLASLGSIPAAVSTASGQTPMQVSAPVNQTPAVVPPQDSGSTDETSATNASNPAPSTPRSHSVTGVERQAAIAQYLMNAQSVGTCVISDNLGSALYNNSGAIPTNWNFHSSILGAQCPVQMSLVANATLSLGGAGVGTFNWVMSSTDPNFLALSDIDSVNISGTVNGNTSGGGALSVGGTFHSQKDGALNFYATLNATNATSVQGTLGIKYSNYTAELELSIKTSGQSQPTLTIQLNNQTLSPQDAATYMSALFPGVTSQTLSR